MRALILALLLAGCAHTPPQVEVTGRATSLPPQKVPVLVPCLTADQIPTPPPTNMSPGFSGDRNTIALALDSKQLDTYVVRSQSLMWGCVKSLEEVK
jgi:hypothetical protein